MNGLPISEQVPNNNDCAGPREAAENDRNFGVFIAFPSSSHEIVPANVFPIKSNLNVVVFNDSIIFNNISIFPKISIFPIKSIKLSIYRSKIMGNVLQN